MDWLDDYMIHLQKMNYLDAMKILNEPLQRGAQHGLTEKGFDVIVSTHLVLHQSRESGYLRVKPRWQMPSVQKRSLHRNGSK